MEDQSIRLNSLLLDKYTTTTTTTTTTIYIYIYGCCCHEASVIAAGGLFYPMVVETLGLWTPFGVRQFQSRHQL